MKNSPCEYCGKQNPADIHTCTPVCIMKNCPHLKAHMKALEKCGEGEFDKGYKEAEEFYKLQLEEVIANIPLDDYQTCFCERDIDHKDHVKEINDYKQACRDKYLT